MTEKMTRRSALSILTGALAAAWTGAVGVLAGAFLSTPLRRRGETREARLGAASLSGDEFRRVNVEVPIKDGWHERSDFITVFVREGAGGSPEVISGVCTHLGCTVNWDNDAQQFKCPCHAGRFSEDGSVISGPPPAPLDRLAAEIRDGNIYIQLSA